jgi:shikimate kinase
MRTNPSKKNNIYLMGFMGCGKTKVGNLLAKKLGWSFLDSDDCIVRDAGLSIPEIFEQKGESYFRKLEKKCIKTISRLNGHVIALGGGAILDPENWEHISRSGMTVTLSYPPEILAARLEKKSDRPLLNETKGNARLIKIIDLLEKRESYYRRADLIIHLNKEVPADRVAETLIGYVKGSVCKS